MRAVLPFGHRVDVDTRVWNRFVVYYAESRTEKGEVCYKKLYETDPFKGRENAKIYKNIVSDWIRNTVQVGGVKADRLLVRTS